MQVNFNDNLTSRKMFFTLLNTLLEIELREDLEQNDYLESFNRMFGKELLDNARKCITGEVRFFGLTPTDINLTSLDKHQRLIASYKKLIQARAKK